MAAAVKRLPNPSRFHTWALANVQKHFSAPALVGRTEQIDSVLATANAEETPRALYRLGDASPAPDPARRHDLVVIADFDTTGATRAAAERVAAGQAPMVHLYTDVYLNFQAALPVISDARSVFREFSAAPDAPELVYAIVTPPRTGSTILSDALSATNLAGGPTEHINPLTTLICKKGLLDGSTILSRLASSARTRNGVFGTKLIFSNYERFLAACAETDKADRGLTQTFGRVKWIRLTREDRVRQAISLFKAVKSGVFNATNEVKYAPGLDYDGAAIRKHLNDLNAMEDRITAYLEARGGEVIGFSYEHVAAHLEEVTLEVLRFLGIAIPEDLKIPQPRLVKLADETTERWYAAFMEEEEVKSRRSAH